MEKAEIPQRSAEYLWDHDAALSISKKIGIQDPVVGALEAQPGNTNVRSHLNLELLSDSNQSSDRKAM